MFSEFVVPELVLQGPTMAEEGKHLSGSSSSIPAQSSPLKQFLRAVWDLEYFPGWRLYNVSWPNVSMFDHSHSKENPSHISLRTLCILYCHWAALRRAFFCLLCILLSGIYPSQSSQPLLRLKVFQSLNYLHGTLLESIFC